MKLLIEMLINVSVQKIKLASPFQAKLHGNEGVDLFCFLTFKGIFS